MRPLLGITMKLVSVTLFIIMSSFIKATSDHIPPGEAVFFRSAFALPPILIWLHLRGELKSGLRMSHPWGHLLRGLLGVSAMGLLFAGLGYLPLPEVTAIAYAGPLLTVVFAALLLGEKVHIVRITAVVLGMVGVLIVLAPNIHFGAEGSGRIAMIGAMIVLGSAVMTALAQVWLRKFVTFEKVTAIVFYFAISATLLSLLTLPFGWAMPSPREAALLIGAGVFGGTGQILLTSSYREADASLIAPFDYASMLLALAIGYFAFAEIPSWQTLGGASLVVIAGIAIIWRERQLGLERAKQRKTATLSGS